MQVVTKMIFFSSKKSVQRDDATSSRVTRYINLLDLPEVFSGVASGDSLRVDVSESDEAAAGAVFLGVFCLESGLLEQDAIKK